MKFVELAFLSLLLVVAQSLSASAADCKAGEDVKMKPERQRTSLSAHISTVPTTVPVGQPFSAKVVICGEEGKLVDSLSIDATMPRHRHGMNYKPTITSGGDRIYEATGLFFHMPGLWRFAVTVQSKEMRQRFTYDVIAK